MRLLLLSMTVLALCACPEMTGTDGGIDAGGGGGGTDAGNGRISGAANALVIQGDKVLIAGSAIVAPTDSDFQLVRVFADGGLDTSFGTDGRVTQAWPTYIDPVAADAGFPIEQKSDDAFVVALQGTKILVAGAVQSQGGQNGFFGIVRYSADGVIDPTFGTDGKTQVKFGFGGIAVSLAQRTDGKIYLGGYVSRGTPGTNGADLGLTRLTADGVLDTSFNTTGTVQQDFGKNEFVRSLAFQGNNVLAAGGDDFLVARYLDDGSLDTTFGTAGIATSLGGFGHNMKVLPTGEILVAGTRRLVGADQPWVVKLVRYTANGQLDATFGTAGVIEAGLDDHQVSVLSLDVLADGRIVLSMAAGFGTLRGVYATAARFSAAGVLDTTAGTGGVIDLTADVPILGGVLPPSPNHGLVSNGKLHYVDTNIGGKVFVIYTTTAI